MRKGISARAQSALPRSLVQRLERMAQGQTWEAAGEGLCDDTFDHRPEPRPAVYFACGLLGGIVFAGGALLGVTAFELQQAGTRNPRLPIARASTPAPAPAAPATLAAQGGQPVAFDVAIDRRDRAHAALGLRLSGAHTGDIEVILSNVPPGAQLSRGERRSSSTWAVKAADLADLHLALGDGTPEAFDVRFDVAAPPGMAAVASIAKVRLVGPVPAAKAAVVEQAQSPVPAKAEPAAQPPPSTAPAPSQKAAATPAEKTARPARRPQAADKKAPEPQDTAQAMPPPPRPWAEAPSALGATSAGEWERQVWWQLPLPWVTTPAPAWSPFLDPPAQR